MASARCYASFYRAGHKYVQDIRNAVAEKFCQEQRRAFLSLDEADAGVLEIALDETEMALTLQANESKAHVIVIHARLSMRSGDEEKSIEVVVPPAVIGSTAAPHLLKALQVRMPFSIVEVAAKCRGELVVVLCTDSGSSCLQLARHLRALPAICRMHQHCLSLVAPLQLGGVMPALFCASLLMKRQRAHTLMVGQLRSYVQRFSRV